MKETRILRITYNISGNGGLSTRIILPIIWIRALGITQEDREVEVSFDGEKIVIEKKKEGVR